MKPKKYRDDPILEKNPLPGPGQYELRSSTAPASGYRANQMSSSFKSRTLRDSYFARGDGVPPPGSYEIPDAFSRTKKTKAGKLPMGPPRLKGLYPVSDVPGPGAYNPQTTPSDRATASALGRDSVVTGSGIRRDHLPATTSSGFRNQNHDRFGNPYSPLVEKHEVPGPGAYAPSLSGDDRNYVGAVLRSGVQRGVEALLPRKGNRPPGPAYYHPKTDNKRSFHFNPAQRWV